MISLKNYKYGTLIFTAALIFCNAEAKVVSSCRDELKQCLAAEKKYIADAFAAGKGWRIKYSVTSLLLNQQSKQYQDHDARGEIIAGQHMRYKKTSSLEVFVDEHDIYTINEKDKTVMHTYTKPNDLKMKDDSYSEILQDTLFSMMMITDCNKAKMGGRDVICYNLKSNLARCPYSSVAIYTDPATKQIVRFHVQMNMNYQKDVKEYTFTVLEKNYVKVERSDEHLREKFFDAKGKLKAPYTSYSVIEPGSYEPPAYRPQNSAKKQK